MNESEKEVKIWKSIVAISAAIAVIIGGAIFGMMWFISIGPFTPERWGERDLSPEAIFERMEIVYDLPEITLVNHDLTEESFFEAVLLETELGNSFMVSMPIESIRDRDGLITHDSPRIGFNSNVIADEEFYDAVSLLENWLKELLFNTDTPMLPNSPIRTNQDRTEAFLHLRIYDGWGTEISRFMLAQVTPDGKEIIILNYFTWAIGTDAFAEDRYAAIVEFSEHIGIDFFEYFDNVRIFDSAWFE